VERIIVTALRKRPDNRYSTMTDMLKDIERAMGLREGDPRGVECVGEDVYEPESEAGNEVMATLRDELGDHAGRPHGAER
jgi:hypothetical protein